MKNKVNFFKAIEAVNNGKLIARESWENDIFVFERPADEIPINIIPNIII